MLVLAAAGTLALRLTLPVTVAIAGLLAVLVVSYCPTARSSQCNPMAAARTQWARRTWAPPVSLLAAVSLVVDYVLTVAVSLAAGAASRRAQSRGPNARPAAW